MKLSAFVLAVIMTTPLSADSWMRLTPDEARMGNSVIAVDPRAPYTVYADAWSVSGLGKSTDGGQTWTVLPHDFRRELLRTIVVELGGPDRVTVMTWDSMDVILHRSVDGGMTWVRSKMDLPIIGLASDLAVDPQNSSTLYVGHPRSCLTTCIEGSGGVSRSIDGGRRWVALYKGIGANHLVIDPHGSGTIYAVGDDLSRRSQNEGTSWTNIVAPPGETISRIALDPVLPGVLYATTERAHLWRSDDRGESWQKLGAPFSFVRAWTIAIDPVRRGVIVAGGSSGLGAQRSMDGGLTWMPLNEGLPIPQNATQLDWVRPVFAMNGRLYASGSVHGAMALQEPPKPRRRAVRH
jgi:photosystem II stability/assembly factor-like uncharacterized protein